MECFLAEDLYDTYENLRSEKDYAEQVFQQELIDRNINLKSNTMNYQIIETMIINTKRTLILSLKPLLSVIQC